MPIDKIFYYFRCGDVLNGRAISPKPFTATKSNDIAKEHAGVDNEN
jgi:hypothetical protein